MENKDAVEVVHTGMGTEIIHKAFGCHAIEALKTIQTESQRIESLISRFLPESAISRINDSSGKKQETISSEICMILSCAIENAAISEGMFDITIGPLVDLWNYKNAVEPPEENQIKLALSLINYKDLELNAVQKSVRLKREGQSIDLGGIGKGFASDRFMEIFKEYGISSAFSNIGGNVSTLGNKPDGSPWRVGIRHPRLNRIIGAVDVSGKAVVTSGDYERYFLDRKGRRFHHILNPLTGYPAESGLLSVTIVAESAMLADALSTMVFIAGLEKGICLLKKYSKIDVVLVDENLKVYVSQGLKQHFQAMKETEISYL